MNVGYLNNDMYLYEVQKKLMYKHKLGIDASLNALYPLSWYVNTGRASATFLRLMYDVKPYVMARLLIKYYDSGTIDECVAAIKEKVLKTA